MRRDFTANAVYYDISEERFVDPLGGIKDIENRILRAARDPYGGAQGGRPQASSDGENSLLLRI